MQIEYYKKSVYGCDFLYIKDEKIANALSNLLKSKTITKVQMNAITSLFGATFIQVLN